MTSHIIPDSQAGWELAQSKLSGKSVVHKFGRNPVVGTTFVPVAVGGSYITPQVSGATQLRIAAGGHANDTANGSGARSVTLVGLNSSGVEITETINTNGASASSATTNSFIRLYRAFVATSGTYATQSASSHAGAITIENAAGGTTWATITATDYASGQTEIAIYTIPLGYTGYISHVYVETDVAKSTDIVLYQRQSILQTSAPYMAARRVLILSGLAGVRIYDPEIPLGPFPALTDIGFLAKVSANTGSVSISFEILLEAT